MYILYTFKCEILHYTISLKVILGPSRIMNMNNFKFCFHFCLLYALSHTNILYVFDLSFLKIILEVLFMGSYSAKYLCYFLQFRNKMAANSLLLDHPCIHIFNFSLLYNLHDIQYQCLLWCKLNLTHGNQHSQNPEN